MPNQTSEPVSVISNPSSSSNSPVISTPVIGINSGRNPMFRAETSASPSNSVVISNPALAGEKSPNKPARFRVTGTDVYFKGKVYPEGSIVNFNDNHLSKYLIPLVEDEIKPEDKILDTPVSPASTDSPLDQKTAASRRRGRPRQP